MSRKLVDRLKDTPFVLLVMLLRGLFKDLFAIFDPSWNDVFRNIRKIRIFDNVYLFSSLFSSRFFLSLNNFSSFLFGHSNLLSKKIL